MTVYSLRCPLRPRSWVYSTRFKPNGPGPYISTKRAVVTERYKLMARGASNEFLYDLVADPREESPLDLGTAANQAIYAPLKARLESMKLLGSP